MAPCLCPVVVCNVMHELVFSVVRGGEKKKKIKTALQTAYTSLLLNAEDRKGAQSMAFQWCRTPVELTWGRGQDGASQIKAPEPRILDKHIKENELSPRKNGNVWPSLAILSQRGE